MQLTIPSVCAVIVSYNPDIPLLLRLAERLQDNACDFLVIDNGSRKIDAFSPSLVAHAHCIGLQQLGENRGLASALNLGLQRLGREGYQFALLFDQDSGIGRDYLLNILLAWEEARSIPGVRVAAIGPRLQDPRTGRRTPFRVFGQLFSGHDSRVAVSSSLYHAGFLITSGTLLPLTHLHQIGLMREDYFIDNVDLEWCFRARGCGYALFGTDRAVLHHRIGEDSDSALVRRGLMASHPPSRTYFTTRNRLHLYRQPYVPLDWKVRDSGRFLLKSLWLLLFSPLRREYWRALRRGISDARQLS